MALVNRRTKTAYKNGISEYTLVFVKEEGEGRESYIFSVYCFI